MTERIAFAAMALLLAGHVYLGARSPEAVALAGTYVASAGPSAETYVLTLGTDASATLVTRPSGDANQERLETGAWVLEGSTVQIAVRAGTTTGNATALTLDLVDGKLVAEPGD